MADKTITQLTAAATPLAGTEVLPIVQSSATVKVAVNDLTVKNLRSNATTGILQVAGPGAAATRVMTTPDANFTVARTDAAQSFTGDQTLATGNAIFSTAGKGSNFTANTPATGMTSQLLSWYEEGTTTPLSGALTTNFSFSTNQIRYTRIGDTVHVWFDYQWTSTNAGAGDTALDKLPFTASGDGVVTFTTMNGNIAASQVYGIVLNGTKSFKIYGRNSGTATLYGPAPRTIWDAGGVNVNKLIGYAVYKTA